MLDAKALETLGSDALNAALHPCQAVTVQWPETARVPATPLSVAAQLRRPARSGSINAQLVFESNGRQTRVPLRLTAECPPPILQPGTRVRILVHVGSVQATAPGEARQSGRIGDRVRVTNLLSRRTVVAEVVDGETVRLTR